MIMDLPTQYRLKTYARVQKGALIIFRSTRYEDLMYSITYSLKKRVCIYCEKTMHERNCTLDHRYPIDLGGISITDNLFPCCPDCNSKKCNLTHEEYLVLLSLQDHDKKAYRKQVEKKNEEIKKAIGFRLPNEWVTYSSIHDILYHRPAIEIYGLQYSKIMEHHSRYGTFPRPIVVDSEFRLLDGYNIVFFARENNIENIPVIWLENVHYLTKKQNFVVQNIANAKGQ